MMRLNSIKLILLGIFVLLTHRSIGEPIEPPLIDVQFTAFMWDRPLNGQIYYSNDGEDISLNLPNLQRSPKYDYKGPSPIRFYRLSKNADGLLERQTVAEANVSLTTQDPLLIFIPSPVKADRRMSYEVAVLDDRVKDFPANSYRFVNLSPYALTGKIGSVEVDLPKRGSISTVGTEVEELSNQNVEFFYESEKGWKPGFQTVWRIDPRERMLVFIVRSDKKYLGPLQLKVVPQLILDPMGTISSAPES